MATEVWGIDIGKSSLKAVKMRRIKNQVEIIGIEIVEYVQTSEEETDREEQVRQALVELRNRAKIKKSESIFISIPGQATFNRMITIPPVETKRVKEIVTYEAQQQIPFPIDEVLWDYQLLEDKEKGLEEQEVILFAVRKEIINNFVANLRAVDISVEGIQIAPLAVYNYIRFDRPELQRCVVIDIGAQNTDLVIIQGNKLWVRALPSAGDDITKALQKKFNIPYEEAEKLKLKAGKTKQAKKIFEVIKPVLKDIVGEIHRSVGYYKSMVKDIKFEKMLFMGNATKLTGFAQFFSQNLQYDIEVVSQLNQVRISPQVNVNLFQTNITGFSVSMGLAVQGLGLAKNNIRLLPKEIYEKTMREKQKPILVAAVAILALAPIFTYIWYSTKASQATTLYKQGSPYQAKWAEFSGRLTEAQTYAEGADTEDTVRKLAQIGHGRERWMEVINSLNESFLQAHQRMTESKGATPWILDFKIKEVVKEPPSEGTTAAKPEKTGSYIEVKFRISLKQVGTKRADTTELLEEHFTKLLKDYKDSQGKPLYEEVNLDADFRPRTQFPELKSEGDSEKRYCYATYILKCWIVENEPVQKKVEEEAPVQ